MSSSNRIIKFGVTPGLASARKSVGDATRCLNGIIVALETLKHVDPVKPPDLQMSWHKSDNLSDFDEMRTFAVKSAIVTVMDGLDQYLRVTSRVPGLVPEALHDDLNGRRDPKIERRRTVAERLRVLASYVPNAVDGRILLIVDLLGAWRNEFVHGDKRHRLGNSQLKEIKGSDAWFKSERGGADVVGLVHRYQNEQAPSLMDLVTLFASTQRALFNIDERLLFQMTAKEYALALTHHLLHEDPDPKQRLDKIFEHGGFKTCARLRTWFLSRGCCSMGKVIGSGPAMTRAEFNAVLGMGRNKASELFRIPRD